MGKFGEDETPSTYLMKISSMRVESKENVKDFNQIFITMLIYGFKSNDVILMEFYTKYLPHSMAIIGSRWLEKIL